MFKGIITFAVGFDCFVAKLDEKKIESWCRLNCSLCPMLRNMPTSAGEAQVIPCLLNFIRGAWPIFKQLWPQLEVGAAFFDNFCNLPKMTIWPSHPSHPLHWAGMCMREEEYKFLRRHCVIIYTVISIHKHLSCLTPHYEGWLFTYTFWCGLLSWSRHRNVLISTL